MRIINRDGSEAEMCGNGVRCLARYIYDRGLVPPSSRGFSIETLAGKKKVELIKSRGRLTEIKVGMGEPEFRADRIPVAKEVCNKEQLDIKLISGYSLNAGNTALSLSFVSMGNPHAIYFIKEPVAGFPLLALGPEVENNPVFPRRINFEVARITGDDSIEARVWERGAGETNGIAAPVPVLLLFPHSFRAMLGAGLASDYREAR
jgi:diaminopimelate epimerase